MPPKYCPICKKPVLPAEKNEAFPFCSARCRLIDLGNWLDDRYRIPGEPTDDVLSAPTTRDEDDR